MKTKLAVFDIDDTLMSTTAMIRVVSDGVVIKTLTNQEFNNYELGPNEEFDFSEFRCSRKFATESKPILPMINKLKESHANGEKVIMLTARADFDDRDLFLQTFKDHGIAIHDIHVHRAGNLSGNESPALKKAVFLRKYLSTGMYTSVAMFDDSRKNLEVFVSLGKEYPTVNFEAVFVKEHGTTELFV